MKQDINGVRTAQDLERKYNLSQNIPQIGELQKNYELQKNGLNKVENELTNFAKATIKNIEDMQNQVDGNITTWFSSGIPSLDNYPANEWTTNDEKNNHLGDLYYNKETGYAYRFTLENNVYKWIDIKDTDVTKALALANSAKDTADRKRQVFVVEPIPPYDCGDLWIKDEELYRCQTTKGSGENFEDNDWIIATKYTDDTVANQVGQNLTILSGTVTEIRNDVDELNTTMTNTTKLVDEQGNTIGILEQKQSETSQTVDGISTQVSSVKKGLETTNNNLSNTDKKVNSLEENINGVTANFNDFKDNEYVNSISNLQDQIDGAIQFWNGADIPTVNNYPANEWLTENDKNNHRADIYTVIQDADGEMKQGKSYRFDKVNNTWQWIELTDNELSAVQAIAQEALNKSNANTTDIGTLKKSVSTLEQTDSEIKANVTSISNQIIPTAQQSGSNIHLENSSDNKLINLEIEGKSTQETRSGKNLLPNSAKSGVINGLTFTVNKDKSISIKGTATARTLFNINSTKPIKLLTNSQYTLSKNGDIECVEIYLRKSSVSEIIASMTKSQASKTFTNTYAEDMFCYIAINSGVTIDTTITLQLEKGTVATEYESYGAMPSSDYPSEIKSVGMYNSNTGKYEIEVVNTGENLLKGLSTPLTDNDYWSDVNKAYFTPLEDGFGRFSYDNTNGSSTVFINAKVKFDAIKLKPNILYTIVTEIRNSEISENSNTFLQLVTNNSTVAFQTSKSLGYEAINTGGTYKGVVTTKANFDNVNVAIDTYLRLAKGTKGTVEARISLFEGDVEVDVSNFVYEPYKEHRTLFVLNDQLRSLPNGVRDIAYIKNNKLYVERKVKSNLVNISKIVLLSNGNIGGIYNSTNKIVKSKNSLLCSSAIEDKKNSLKEETVYENPANFVFVGNSTDTLETLKAKYDNSEIIYELAEPYTEELGEIEMPSTYKNVTNITTTDELEPNLNIEYVRDTKVTDYVERQLNSYETIQEQKFAEQKITTDGITNKVSYIETSLNNDYTKNDELNQKLEEQKQQIITSQETLITQSKDAWALEVIQKLNSDGIEKLKNTLVSIDLNGLNVSKSDEDIVSLLNNLGLYVSDGKLKEDLSNLLMKADRTGAYFKIIEILATIKEQEIIQKEKIKDDKYGTCQAWYWIGG